jgi:hypothetical protein
MWLVIGVILTSNSVNQKFRLAQDNKDVMEGAEGSFCTLNYHQKRLSTHL